MTKNLIFIGYRGTGKTTLARKLGEKLGVPHFDSDPEIERRAEKNIAAIFAERGEHGFRDLEAETIAEIVHHAEKIGQPFILATGGGAILRPENRELLRKSGVVVWLTASPETILKRITGDAASATMRPNLTALPPLEEIVSLLEKRNPLYRETAHRIIDTEKESLDDIIAKLSR